MIEEALKTQPNAKFIVNINTLSETDDPKGLFRIYDYTPFSFNKLQSIHKTCGWYNFSIDKELTYYFPIIQFHDRWKSLQPADFTYVNKNYKGSSTTPSYLGRIANLTKKYNTGDHTVELSPFLESGVTDLLDYCDKKKPDITFVTIPQAKDYEFLGKYNTINAMIEERGYKVLDLIDHPEEIGLDIRKDMYNAKHANIHGSIKYTYWLSEYLIDTYGFEDKRGNPDYSSWDEGLENYKKEIDSSILPFQLDSSYDPSILPEPQKLTVTSNDIMNTLIWETVEGADGYAVYKKKNEKGTWTLAEETTEQSFNDIDITGNGDYYYRVVPFVKSDGKTSYGDFSYKGAMITINNK
jgi:hypothetical protein